MPNRRIQDEVISERMKCISLQGAAPSGLNIYIAIYPGLHSVANSLITARTVHFRAYSPISLNIKPKRKGLKVRKMSAQAEMKELKRLNAGLGQD